MSLFRKIFHRENYIDLLRRQGAKIGEGCDINNSVIFGSEPYLITIGNHVRINSGVNLITHDGGCWVLRKVEYGFDPDFQNADCFGTIKICDNVHIGNNAIIMPGVTVGENSIIACGAVVTKDVPPHSVYGGVPARKIETIEEYAAKMKKKFVPTKGYSYEKKKAYLKAIFKL